MRILSRLDDDELVRRLAEGSDAARDEVLARHGPFIYRLAVELLRDHAQAEERTAAVIRRLTDRLCANDDVPTRSLLGLLLDETLVCPRAAPALVAVTSDPFRGGPRAASSSRHE